MSQPLWSEIAQHKPDVWAWLGDIVYVDRQVYPVWDPQPVHSLSQFDITIAVVIFSLELSVKNTLQLHWVENNLTTVEQIWQAQKTRPEYIEFLRSGVKHVLGMFHIAEINRDTGVSPHH